MTVELITRCLFRDSEREARPRSFPASGEDSSSEMLLLLALILLLVLILSLLKSVGEERGEVLPWDEPG